MKKIKIGIFGPSGRMGNDLVEQIKSFKSLEMATILRQNPQFWNKLITLLEKHN